MYVLFDATPSSSEILRQGYREDVSLAALVFCDRYPDHSSIDLNLITANPQEDSVFQPVDCPGGVNATQRGDTEVALQSTIQATLSGLITNQSSVHKSDVIGAILYGAQQTFLRLKPSNRYLMIFSDMQQSGDGVRNCVKQAGPERAPGCLKVYFRRHSEYPSFGMLTGVEVFVSGFGMTVRGTIAPREWESYKRFWQAFFAEEGARVCKFGVERLPIRTTGFGVRSIDPSYFKSNCSPVL
jgi:hypothetical protein